MDIYPDGEASKANHVPMMPFMPTQSYGDIAGASGCYAETITEAQERPAALERALIVIREEKRQVLLDVQVGMDDGEKQVRCFLSRANRFQPVDLTVEIGLRRRRAPMRAPTKLRYALCGQT